MYEVFKKILGLRDYTERPQRKKREHEWILGINKYGEVIITESCLPIEREKHIKHIFEANPEVVTINICPLKGKTKIITR